jgi:hypothetical protein
MPRTKHDRALVASSSYSELKVVCVRYNIGVKTLRAILLEIGQNGKPEHSRKEIYAELEKRGYVKGVGKLPEDSEAPQPVSDVYVNG